MCRGRCQPPPPTTHTSRKKTGPGRITRAGQPSPTCGANRLSNQKRLWLVFVVEDAGVATEVAGVVLACSREMQRRCQQPAVAVRGISFARAGKPTCDG